MWIHNKSIITISVLHYLKIKIWIVILINKGASELFLNILYHSTELWLQITVSINMLIQICYPL